MRPPSLGSLALITAGVVELLGRTTPKRFLCRVKDPPWPRPGSRNSTQRYGLHCEGVSGLLPERWQCFHPRELEWA
jgi:hypothetical protein